MAQGSAIQGYFPGGPRIPTSPAPVQPRSVQPPAAQPRSVQPHPRTLRAGVPQPNVAQPRSMQPRNVAGHGPVVQRVGNGDAIQLPANLSNFGGGAGQPLPKPVLQKMESFFNTSFADVRVHVGPQASSIGALAFTQGSNLYFAPGQFNPSTLQGQQLLGHELAHVVQQRAGRVRNPFGSGVAVVQDRGMEAEADRMGLRAAAHEVALQAKPATGGIVPSALQAGGPRLSTVLSQGGLPPRPLVQRSMQAKPAAAQPSARVGMTALFTAHPLGGRTGVAQRSSVLQAVLVGTDPLQDLSNPNSKSLAYGTSTARTVTIHRVQQHAQDQQLANRYRTIDEYNDHIGLSNFMGGDLDPCKIFVVREALADLNPVANWRTSFPLANQGMETDQDLLDWISMLVQHRDYVGLYNLGGKSGKQKLGINVFSTKARYKKNFISTNRYKHSGLTPSLIQEWLSDKTLDQAKLDALNLAPTLKQDLALWIRKAFWRRTSKLGIDFTIRRGHNIHINIAGDKNFDPETMHPNQMVLKAGELKKFDPTYGRLITTSEYRHLKKGLRKGTFPKNQVNFYSEF